jgi:hypothetical protein
MPVAMKVPFQQTRLCHTATDHVLTEVLLLLHAVLIIYDPEEVASYYLPGLLWSSILCILHCSSFSSRHSHFLKLFVSPCSSIYLLSSTFPFYSSIKTSLFLLFLRSFSFLFSTVSSCFLHFLLSQPLPPLNFSFHLLLLLATSFTLNFFWSVTFFLPHFPLFFVFPLPSSLWTPPLCPLAVLPVAQLRTRCEAHDNYTPVVTSSALPAVKIIIKNSWRQIKSSTT